MYVNAADCVFHLAALIEIGIRALKI